MVEAAHGSEESQSEVAAVAQANRAYYGTVEEESNGKADIDGRLRTTMPPAHEVPERQCLTSPVEHLNLGRRESSNRQLRFNLTDK